MSAPTLDLEGLLRRLHLPTVRRLYPELETRAEVEDLSYRDFLATLMAEEVAHRAQTRIERSVRKAHFPFLRSSEKVIVVDIYDPFHLEQLEQARDLGQPARRNAVRGATETIKKALGNDCF